MASLKDEIGDFVGIPHSFIEDDQQTAESRVVFMVLRYHTNRKRKRAFPGYETIMRETGLSRQKTAAGIKVLVKTGWLVKHKIFAKNTEYEIRYPAPAYSSTGELREGAPIVPPGNCLSSTMEQPPLMDPNKIEFNKIKNTDPLLSPKGSYRRAVKPPLEPELAPPYAGPPFLAALSTFEALQRELKKPIGPVRRKSLYDKLAVWSEEAATRNLIEATTNGWAGVFAPKEQNSNGQRYESAAERDARYMRESLNNINNLSTGGGEDNPESATRLLAANAGTPATNPRR